VAPADLIADVMISLAGKAAERRCLRASAQGWRRMRTADEVRAHHEAGHAVAAVVHGQYVWRLSIIRDESVRVQQTGISMGHCIRGHTPEPPGLIKRSARADTDLHQAAKACLFLAIAEPPYGVRAAMRIAHRLQVRTREMVEQHWPQIARLASELMERRELGSSEIERIVNRSKRLFPRACLGAPFPA
jgi:hypothetical protein